MKADVDTQVATQRQALLDEQHEALQSAARALCTLAAEILEAAEKTKARPPAINSTGLTNLTREITTAHARLRGMYDFKR